MRCLNCEKTGIDPSRRSCPHCSVNFAELYRTYCLLEPGRSLGDGDYKILEVLGRGGFGVTYKAYSRSFAAEVAIKEYFPKDYARRDGTSSTITYRRPDDKEPYERWMRRFKREGQVLFRLKHPNIVRVSRLLEENNTLYLVMDYLEGHTLKDELAPLHMKGHRLASERIVELMDSLVSALHQVHAQRPPIYHLDLKPDNVMITPSGEIILIDFGASRLATTDSSSMARTENYAPPELLIAGEIGSHSDIYELGMLLHELLTGALPPMAYSRVLGKSKGWEPELEEPWQSLVESALRLEPEERPKNVKAWWERYSRWHQEQEKVKREAETEKRRVEDRDRHRREAEERLRRQQDAEKKRLEEERDRHRREEAAALRRQQAEEAEKKRLSREIERLRQEEARLKQLEKKTASVYLVPQSLLDTATSVNSFGHNGIGWCHQLGNDQSTILTRGSDLGSPFRAEKCSTHESS